MMSPDPPNRQPSESDGLPPNEATFIPVWDDDDNDDIFGNEIGPYELDIGGDDDEESDFSESGDEHGHTHHYRDSQPVQNVNEETTGQSSLEQGDTVVTTSSRGHYQLLIPFPIISSSEQDDDNGGSHDDDASFSGFNANFNNDPIVESSLHSHSIEDEDTHENQQSEEVVQNRDINLTEENVQVIKSVMMNFSLPSASIPSWAEKMSDDLLKNRLSACIDEKKEVNKFSNK